jgi:hypothetical protein
MLTTRGGRKAWPPPPSSSRPAFSPVTCTRFGTKSNICFLKPQGVNVHNDNNFCRFRPFLWQNVLIKSSVVIIFVHYFCATFVKIGNILKILLVN